MIKGLIASYQLGLRRIRARHATMQCMYGSEKKWNELIGAIYYFGNICNFCGPSQICKDLMLATCYDKGMFSDVIVCTSNYMLVKVLVS